MTQYTQEQLDQAIADAKKGLFDENELNKRVTAEVDRRVESGIQKGLETHKAKMEKEAFEKANLTAEQLAQKQFEEKLKEVSTRELEIKKRANKLDAMDMLTEAQIPKVQYEKLLGMLVSDDAELTKTNVNGFIEMFTATKTDIETKVKTELSKIAPPIVGGSTEITKESFAKMGYAEKLKLKAEKPELYSQFLK